MNVDKRLINVRVQPRAKMAGVEKISPDELKVRVLSPPSKGEANEEVIRQIALYFGIPVSRVTIVRGHNSRRKLIALRPQLIWRRGRREKRDRRDKRRQM